MPENQDDFPGDVDARVVVVVLFVVGDAVACEKDLARQVTARRETERDEIAALSVPAVDRSRTAKMCPQTIARTQVRADDHRKLQHLWLQSRVPELAGDKFGGLFELRRPRRAAL